MILKKVYIQLKNYTRLILKFSWVSRCFGLLFLNKKTNSILWKKKNCMTTSVSTIWPYCFHSFYCSDSELNRIKIAYPSDCFLDETQRIHEDWDGNSPRTLFTVQPRTRNKTHNPVWILPFDVFPVPKLTSSVRKRKWGVTPFFTINHSGFSILRSDGTTGTWIAKNYRRPKITYD